ncbi:MAG: hypothetical protein EXS63_02045 [Candidatus Omnitrophica bacterium]|nr:hypothetical protein [Candidatus Omnitrophota bacterium]
MERENIFKIITREFKKRKIRCVLIGGFAINQYRPARHTADIDFLVDEKDFSSIDSILKPYGFKNGPRTSIFARLEALQQQEMDLDFLFVDAEILKRIFDEGQFVRIGGERFVIPSIEHLIALKLHAVKNNPARQLKDLFDILEMIEANRLNVRTEKFKKLCLNYGSRELYEKILQHCTKARS